MKKNKNLILGLLLLIAIVCFVSNNHEPSIPPQVKKEIPKEIPVAIQGESKLSLPKVVEEIKVEKKLQEKTERNVSSAQPESQPEIVVVKETKTVVVNKKPTPIKKVVKKQNRHSLSVYGELSYSRLDVKDVNNGSSASALSNLNKGVGIKYRYKASDKVQLSVEYKVRKTTMDQSDSNRQILNSDVTTNHIEGRVQYSPDNHFYGAGKVGNSQYIFLEPNGLDFNASVKGLNFYGLDVGYKSYFKYCNLTLNLGLNQYLGNQDGSVKVINGQGFMGNLIFDSSAWGVPFFLEGYYGQTTFGIGYPLSNNTFEQKTQDLGLKLGLKFNF